MKTINMNDTVYIKLNDMGRNILRRNHDSLATISPYREPREDADGYSKWQLWELFQEFGIEVGIGFEIPFDTNIRIKE